MGDDYLSRMVAIYEFFWVCGAFIQIWTIGTLENGHNFWEKIRPGTPVGLYHSAWSKFQLSKQKDELMPLPTKFDSIFNQMVFKKSRKMKILRM
jgi:hypothetical protein